MLSKRHPIKYVLFDNNARPARPRRTRPNRPNTKKIRPPRPRQTPTATKIPMPCAACALATSATSTGYAGRRPLAWLAYNEARAWHLKFIRVWPQCPRPLRSYLIPLCETSRGWNPIDRQRGLPDNPEWVNRKFPHLPNLHRCKLRCCIFLVLEVELKKRAQKVLALHVLQDNY